MKARELEQLFEHQSVPEASREAKRRATREALAAFRETRAQIEQRQRRTLGQRVCALWESQTFERFRDRFAAHRRLVSGLATACVLVVGVLLFHQPPPPLEQAPARGPLSGQGDGRGGDTAHPEVADSTQASVGAAEIVADLDNSGQNRSPAPALRADRRVPSAMAEAKASAGFRRQAQTLKQVESPQATRPDASFAGRSLAATSKGGMIRTTQRAVSTFAVNVGTDSYRYLRRQLNAGVWPAAEAVRVEEILNYFDYQYPKPAEPARPFEPTVVVHESPWREGSLLLHIGVQGYERPPGSRAASHLVFLVAVSESASGAEQLPWVKQALRTLLDTLQPTDTVAIVAPTGAAETLLPPTPAREKTAILEALARLQAGGPPVDAADIARAYRLAESHETAGAINRVVLVTDGEGGSGGEPRPGALVERMRERGVELFVLELGAGRKPSWQALAHQGGGTVASIGTLGEALRRVHEAATLQSRPIAEEVAIQVEFDPETVAAYRLVGFDTREANRDGVDPGTLSAAEDSVKAGHTVTAIYEMTPTRAASGQATAYGEFRISYKLPGDTNRQQISVPLRSDDGATEAPLAGEVNFATAVAGAGLVFGNRDLDTAFDLERALQWASDNRGRDTYGLRSEFVEPLRQAEAAEAQ